MMRLIGAVMIIAAGSLAGISYASRFTERCRILKLWIRVCEILAIEIGYQNRFLPEVFQRVAVLIEDRDLGVAFREMADALEYGAAGEIETVWEHLLNRTDPGVLHEADRLILRELGSYMGGTDREHQIEQLKTSILRLESNLRLAETERGQKVGVFRYLGFAIGAVLALWLI